MTDEANARGGRRHLADFWPDRPQEELAWAVGTIT
jgi:hypothetical protein